MPWRELTRRSFCSAAAFMAFTMVSCAWRTLRRDALSCLE